MRIITTTCFGPICGPSSGCDWTFGSVIQECVERSWGVLGEGLDLIIAVGTMAPGFFPGGLPLVVCSALFSTPRITQN